MPAPAPPPDLCPRPSGARRRGRPALARPHNPPPPAASASASVRHRESRHRPLKTSKPACSSAARSTHRRGEIGAAVAEEDLLRGGLRHLCVCIGGPGSFIKRKPGSGAQWSAARRSSVRRLDGEPRHTRKPMLSHEAVRRRRSCGRRRQLHGRPLPHPPAASGNQARFRTPTQNRSSVRHRFSCHAS